jgi:hypothetical protein
MVLYRQHNGLMVAMLKMVTAICVKIMKDKKSTNPASETDRIQQNTRTLQDLYE